MRLELSALAADRWPAIRRTVAAQIAADLLAELDHLLALGSRLHLEQVLRADEFRHREVA